MKNKSCPYFRGNFICNQPYCPLERGRFIAALEYWYCCDSPNCINPSMALFTRDIGMEDRKMAKRVDVGKWFTKPDWVRYFIQYGSKGMDSWVFREICEQLVIAEVNMVGNEMSLENSML